MEQSKKTQNKIVQTYTEDMVKVIESDKSGLIKKIISEEKKHEEEKKNLSPESKKNRFLLFMGLIFILLGLTTLFYFLFNKDISTVSIEKQFLPLIFSDKNVFIDIKDLKKDEIVRTVLNEINKTEVKNGGVEVIYLTSDKKIIGWREFSALIKGNFQPEADQLSVDVSADQVNLVSDNFLMGVVNNTTKDFFILLKVRSVTDIFDSLRAWENKIFFDLYGFFGVSISTETKNLFTKSLEDGIVQNKNARILYDQDNKIVMMYIFADDNSVIITNTENAAQEIMLRLVASRIKK